MKYIIFFVFLIGSISASLRSRIIGGENADIKHFPYQVSLRLRGDHFCGGCIISDRHILTAAHCFTHNRYIAWPYLEVTVSSGTSSTRETGYSHHIVSVAIHPGWMGSTRTSALNDIAVITLQDRISFNEEHQKIRLASRDVVSGRTTTLTGWGHTIPRNGKHSVQLQMLKMTLLNSTDCQRRSRVEIDEKQLCAFQTIGRGSCLGDSGGPLVVNNEVVGILSWVVNGCFAVGAAEVFTNVYAQKDFIESEINKL